MAKLAWVAKARAISSSSGSKIALVGKSKGQTTDRLAARYQGNHQHGLYAESQQIGAFVFRNWRAGDRERAGR